MMFEKYPNDRLKAFEEYSKHRNPDAEAMCDLAMYNYIEVRKKPWSKGGFLSESAISFSNLQKNNIPKNYPELEI